MANAGIPDDTMERVMAYFTAAQPQLQGATAPAAPPAPTADDGDATGTQQGKAPVRKSRAWEARPENKPFTYRVGQDVHDLILAAVEAYRQAGYQTTTSAVARAWLKAGCEQWQEKKVQVDARPTLTVKVARP